jgi:twitching motility protein PilT
VGRDVRSFKEGTIQALRQDPDIIVIGEMRDPDTIATVLEAADSGHKVFTTLHTSSAVESIDRILGESQPMEQTRIRERLASVLTCVMSQKLIPSLDGKLVLAKEVMVANVSVRAAIRNNHTDEIYQIIQQGSNEGMTTMEQDLARLYKNRVVSYEEAINNANNKKRFEDLVKYDRRLA